MKKSKKSHNTPKQEKPCKEEKKPTLSDLSANFDLWFRICVLLHDIHNISSDKHAAKRIDLTIDSLYISTPFFTAGEAALIKSTTIPPPVLNQVPEFEALELEEESPVEHSKELTVGDEVTVEEAITSFLRDFGEKRRASGDARPCGPHDLGPVYRAVFGITNEELRGEKFLGRLRRWKWEC